MTQRPGVVDNACCYDSILYPILHILRDLKVVASALVPRANCEHIEAQIIVLVMA